MFDISLVATAPMAAIPAATSCPGLDAVNPLCYAAGAVGSIGGSVATAGVDAVLGGLSQWVASGAEWLLSQIGNVLTSTTTIDLGADWFRTHYAVMTALAAVVVLPLLLVSTLQAVFRQNAGQLIRAFFVQLPLALLLGVVAIQIVILCLSATDAMCTAVAGGSGSDVNTLLAGMTKGLVIAVGDPTMATFVLLLVGLLVAAAAFVLWLELLVRAAAVYVAVLFLPLALVALVWPAVSHWCRRLVETLAALILSKFVIVATLSLAAERGGVRNRRWFDLCLGPGRRRPPRPLHFRPLFHPPSHPDGRSGRHRASRGRAPTRHGRGDPTATQCSPARAERGDGGAWRGEIGGTDRSTGNGGAHRTRSGRSEGGHRG